MTKKEALKLALEALVEMTPSGPNGSAIWHKQMSAITAASEALAQPEQDYLAGVPPMLPQMRDGETIVVTEYAQPEQEPVAWMHPDWLTYTRAPAPVVSYKENWKPLYTHPQPKRETPKAGDGHDLFYEAVRLLDNAIFAQSGDVVRHDSAAHKEALDFFNHVFTQLDLPPTQPKREWVGLTDEEREEATGWSVEHIEAKLKEKNT